jgi:hypothetical protein
MDEALPILVVVLIGNAVTYFCLFLMRKKVPRLTAVILRHKHLAFMAMSIAWAGAFIHYRYSFSPPEAIFIERLEHAFQTNTESVRLEHLTDFPWSRVCYVGPYARDHVSKDEQGEMISKARSNVWWIGDDNHHGLLFNNDGAITAIRVSSIRIEVRRKDSEPPPQPDPSRDSRRRPPPACFGRDDSVMYLVSENDVRIAYLERKSNAK